MTWTMMNKHKKFHAQHFYVLDWKSNTDYNITYNVFYTSVGLNLSKIASTNLYSKKIAKSC